MKYRKMSNRLSIGCVLIFLDGRSSRLRRFAVQISRVKKLTSGATKPLVLAFSGEARGPAVVVLEVQEASGAGAALGRHGEPWTRPNADQGAADDVPMVLKFY